MNLNQVTIYSSKPTESLEFYKKLGLRLIVDSAPRYVRFECPDGDSTLSIHETVHDSSCSNIVLYFECENLAVEVKRLKSLGLTFESEPADQTWLWREAYLKDPSGNRICLFYGGENRKNPPWKVKSDVTNLNQFPVANGDKYNSVGCNEPKANGNPTDRRKTIRSLKVSNTFH